ncbi:MAG: hypothetical protein IPI79_00770 [Moraxellaceae bacterium]|nr:hypothetical protein [Moraxellaceae bacterium]
MNKLLRYGLCFGAIWLSVPSWAWVKEYQTEYLLGDNDSRLNAKQNALNQIQLQAMQEAGTYIQGQTQLLNEQLEERISQVSAAIVKLDVLSERFEFTAQGQQKLRLVARANVDESILQDRVRTLQIEANKVRNTDKLAQDNQQMRQQLQKMEQQKLALENQLLRQKLSRLEQQQQLLSVSKPEVILPVVIPLQGTESSVAVVLTQEGQQTPFNESSFLMGLTQALQKTPVAVRVNSEEPVVKIQPDWRLSLTPESPLNALCRRWTCVLGYAYKAPFNDALTTPLHQQLFRPFSRVVHIDDKYISHWQLLTLQAYPPKDINFQDRQFIESYRLMVQVRVDEQKLDVPLIQYDKEAGALVVALQGAVNEPQMTAYNYQTRQGYVMCALTNSAKQCANTDLTQFAWHVVNTPLGQGIKISTKIVSF